MVVDAFCQVTDGIFAFGDVCMTPAQEEKSIVAMYQYVHAITHNVLQSALGKKGRKAIP